MGLLLAANDRLMFHVDGLLFEAFPPYMIIPFMNDPKQH